ncbi:MBL fold metallo-hydrolase [Dellaglioa algida]|uniref:Beta-lactamase domain-containing protein n=1 Tax=Dellaglioa algida DSM 15638 TaxID=1423719 RepID=A0A0R1HPQ0_9LACO|nr:MBL fold metallo-hydrolase [Dellaglioa algida]KRK45361.1 beta-lactamase domain-containing protein [Dellaglioa algida DSM 15638]MDK1719164.1 MBL fold metallo-hydrolase [Dellaglioa algida]MDK1728708.1 MBL fold metallo-hydrolase [Dellaglioa algida]MDK1730433.1 MBL fold metallo-hydrolase [Dellaglioa algida]MDK1733298.1 MBL fold metallo-hydrolase [Dellaglioa algida]
MKLTILGFYGGYPAHEIGTSSYLIQSNGFNLLLDCGSGAMLSLEQKLNPLNLDAVVLSHYHQDHIADVGVLQYDWQINGDEVSKALPIYGPKIDQEAFSKLTWADATVGVGYTNGEVVEIGPFVFEFIETIHPVPAYAMKITESATGKVFVFTADTAYDEKLNTISQNADLLMTDTNFFNDKVGKKWHMTAGESGRFARINHVKRLLLTHLPAMGSHELLKQQAELEAGEDVTVLLAEKYLKVIL